MASICSPGSPRTGSWRSRPISPRHFRVWLPAIGEPRSPAPAEPSTSCSSDAQTRSCSHWCACAVPRKCWSATWRSISSRSAKPRSARSANCSRISGGSIRASRPASQPSGWLDRSHRCLGQAPPCPCPPAATTATADEQLVAQSRPTKTAGFRLEIVGQDSLFESFAGGRADLRSLLAAGVLLIEPGGTLPSWSGRGVRLPALSKDLVQSALEVVRAIEEGDPEHELPLDNGVALALCLGSRPSRRLRPGRTPRQAGGLAGIPAPASQCPLLTMLFQAALAFGALATRRNARQAQNQPLVTLLSDAHEGLARCREVAAEPPAIAALTVVPRPTAVERGGVTEAKLAPGRLRLLSYRVAWRTPLTTPVRRLQRAGGLLLVHRDGGVSGLSAARGVVRWAFNGEGALVAAATGLTLAAVGNRIVRVDGRPGARWEGLTVTGPIRSLVCAGETKARTAVAATDFEVLSFDASNGRALWRFSPPGAARLAVHSIRGLLVISTGDGRLYGVRPHDGRLLWRARGKLLDGPASYQEWLLTIGRNPSQLTGVSLAGGGTIRQFRPRPSTPSELEDRRRGHGGLGPRSGRGPGWKRSRRRNQPGWWRPLELGSRRAAWPWCAALALAVSRGLLVRGGRSLSRLEADGRIALEPPALRKSLPRWRSHRCAGGVAISAGDAGLFAFDEGPAPCFGQVDDAQPNRGGAGSGRPAQRPTWRSRDPGPVRAARQVERFLSVV